MLRSAPRSRGEFPRFILALAVVASGCAPITFERLADRCVGQRLDEPGCAEAKLAVIAQGRGPGDTGDRVCKGGFQDGEPCATSADCARDAVCWQGARHGESCTTNFDCNDDPEHGSDLCFHDPTRLCDSDADCPGVCEDSGEGCGTDADCSGPPVCVGGVRDTLPCGEPPFCPGTCVGGSSPEECTDDQDCQVCTCSGFADVESGEGLVSWTCSSANPCFDQCIGGDNAGNPCTSSAFCPGGFCALGTDEELEGSCSNPGTCLPRTVRCEQRLCLNDWVICIGKGHCVPEGALGFLPPG